MILCRCFFVNLWFVFVVFSHNGYADLIETTSSYGIAGTNFPTDFDTTVSLDGSVKSLAGGRLEVFERITAIDSNSEWVEFVFSTPGGGPLADDFSSLWMLEIMNVQTTELAFTDYAFIYWSIDSIAVGPLVPNGSGPFASVNQNPIDGSLGDVLGGPITPVGPMDLFSPSVFSQPYSFISSNGVDPQLANGFTLGFRVTAVPEPGVSLIVLLTVQCLVLRTRDIASRGIV